MFQSMFRLFRRFATRTNVRVVRPVLARAMIGLVPFAAAAASLDKKEEKKPEVKPEDKKEAKGTIEYYTQEFFPDKFAYPPCGCASAKQLDSVGVGIRCVYGVCFYSPSRAYSIGLYVDPATVKAAIDRGNTNNLYPNAEDTLFEKVLLSPMSANVLRVLRLKFAQDVRSNHVAFGFSKSLRARAEKNPDVTEAEIKAFADVFNDLKDIKKGTEAVFAWDPFNKELSVWIDGKEKLSVTNQAFAWALFDMYLGHNPISWQAKTPFKEAFDKQFAAKKQ